MEIILQSSNPVDISLDNNKSVEVTNETKAIRGPRGYSNYQIAVQNGFTGSEAEWLLSLVGPQGIPGKDGISGRGITAFTLVKTEGLKNTYQIDYSDGTKTEIVIKNGIASYDDLTDKPKINNVELNDNKFKLNFPKLTEEASYEFTIYGITEPNVLNHKTSLNDIKSYSITVELAKKR